MRSKRFEKFIRIILEHEGRFSVDPDDPGGATNYGVSLRFLKNDLGMLGDFDHDGDLDEQDIIVMTQEQAEDIYYEYFYLPLYIESLENEALALQLFDFGVNAGKSRAVKILQRVLKVPDDGIIGPITIAAANDSECGRCGECYRDARLEYYDQLCVDNPAFAKYRRGWFNRVLNCKV
jgi:lysozyme family protein